MHLLPTASRGGFSKSGRCAQRLRRARSPLAWEIVVGDVGCSLQHTLTRGPPPPPCEPEGIQTGNGLERMEKAMQGGGRMCSKATGRSCTRNPPPPRERGGQESSGEQLTLSQQMAGSSRAMDDSSPFPTTRFRSQTARCWTDPRRMAS